MYIVEPDNRKSIVEITLRELERRESGWFETQVQVTGYRLQVGGKKIMEFLKNKLLHIVA